MHFICIEFNPLKTNGATELALPRARIVCEGGATTEWKSKALRSYQRRTATIDALIASAYLAGSNTRRAKRALASYALVKGAKLDSEVFDILYPQIAESRPPSSYMSGSAIHPAWRWLVTYASQA